MERLSAWVLDGTRFVPPDNEYLENGVIKTTSDERSQLSDDDLRSVVAAFPNLVEIHLAGCGQLTDAAVREIAKCTQLQTLNLQCVGAATSEPSAEPPRAGPARS